MSPHRVAWGVAALAGVCFVCLDRSEPRQRRRGLGAGGRRGVHRDARGVRGARWTDRFPPSAQPDRLDLLRRGRRHAASQAFADAYAVYWLDGQPGPRRVGEAAAAFSNTSWVPFVLVPATFLLLLFPDGRLLSRRWRPLAWCAGVGIAGFFATAVIEPGPLESYPGLENPYGVDGTAVVAAHVDRRGDAADRAHRLAAVARAAAPARAAPSSASRSSGWCGRARSRRPRWWSEPPATTCGLPRSPTR